MHNLSSAWLLNCVRFFIKWEKNLSVQLNDSFDLSSPSLRACGENVSEAPDLTKIVIYELDPADLES